MPFLVLASARASTSDVIKTIGFSGALVSHLVAAEKLSKVVTSVTLQLDHQFSVQRRSMFLA